MLLKPRLFLCIGAARRAVLTFLAASPAALSGVATSAQETPGVAASLTERVPHAKTLGTFTPRPGHFSEQQVIVKFKEGTNVRLRGERLVRERALDSEASATLLAKSNLRPAQVEADLATVASLFRDSPGLRGMRLVYGVSENKLTSLKALAESRSKKQLADMELYYDLRLSRPDTEAVRRLARALSELESVEVAYVQPVPENADIAPTTTIDLRSSQGYRNAAPGGIDSVAVVAMPGGRGEGVKIVDVEFGWELDHEDLPPDFFLRAGIIRWPGDGNSHGTAVMGVLGGLPNTYGVTGIATRSELGVSGVTGFDAAGVRGLVFYSVANAVMVAAAAMDPGDVMLIEQHFPGPSTGTTCSCTNCGQFEFVAMEYFPAEFDAISFATSLGIVVAEAAGNGSMNLDAADYDERFNRSARDSGAIFVGAGTSGAHTPMCPRSTCGRCWRTPGPRRAQAHASGRCPTSRPRSGAPCRTRPRSPE